MTTFEAVVVVDWSASSTPKKGPDSIWVSAVDVDSSQLAHLSNPTTRATAYATIVELASRYAGRVLIGFDFPMGPPAGFAGRVHRSLASETMQPWQAVWDLLAARIIDDERNANNRCEVAAELNRAANALLYWGAPRTRAGAWLTSTKPTPSPFADSPVLSSDPASLLALGAVAQFRTVEQRMRDSGYRPFSWWQLFGAGSVGSQVMTGLPLTHRLRNESLVADRVAIWPFETGLADPAISTAADTVVIAEVWPSMLPRPTIDAVDHPVKDARQVVALAASIAAADRANELADWFTPILTDDETTLVTTEEGWVLGVTANGRPLIQPQEQNR